METEIRAQIAFHLTGRRTGATTNAMAEAGLRPALLAPYRDLASLRYDFPVVLVKNPKDQPAIQSLTEVVDRLLATVATGEDKDRLIRHAHRLEAAIRALVAEVGGGVLRALWDEAGGRLGAHNDALVQDSLKRLRAALRIDGEVVDCDKALPLRALRHAWTQAAEAKALRVRATLDRLATKLADILGADFAHSDKGLSAENLRQGIGPAQRGLIDFDRMSTLLKRATPKIPLAETRRRRIEGLLAVLRGQKFYPLEPGAKAHGFAFAGCGPAMEAFRRRLPEMVDFAKAVAIAELEVDGRYHEARHGPFFEEFGKDGLSGDDLALFPDYLVSVGADDVAEVLKAFAAGLPAKVLVQTDDLLAPIPGGAGRLAFALGGKQLAATAVGLGGVYVLQSTSSNLLRCRDRLAQGVGYEGPALFNVFSGASNGASDLPPYLSAAAAHESRAFPCFVYDPSAGPDLADRFAVSDNPQPERDWPVHDFDYEDEAHQRISEDLPFTLVDYLACDRRYAGHFAVVPKAKANGIMAPVGDFLAGAGGDFAEKVPALLMVDQESRLQRVIVDDRLMREARRCAEMWRGLRELGGIRNSHAERLLERERKTWAEQAPKGDMAAEAKAAPLAKEAPKPAAEAPIAETKPAGDEPYIETPRCTTCNECTQINGKMFAYDANKQAYIADPKAGTYRQLVEAAESCQIAIIHPGKPLNPDEPGLDELIKRAEAFL